MKSKLLATSALAAVGLWGTTEAAFAQAKVAPITVVVGGYMEQTFGWADNQDGVIGGALAAGSKPQSFGQHSDTEIHFGGRTTLANGITIGFDVQLEGNTSTDQIDESYLFVDGAFGRFVIGTENDSAYLMHYAAPGAGKAYGVNDGAGPDWIQRPANHAFIGLTNNQLQGASSASDTAGTGNDHQRMNYFTPRFFGFQGGITYTPSVAEDSNLIFSQTTVRTDNFSGAVNYVNTFSGVSVAVSAGVAYWSSIDGAVANTAGDDSIVDYAFGFQLGYMGFVVGGAYRKYDAGDFNVNDGYAYNIGATYTTGPFAVGLGWHHSNARGLLSDGADDKADVIILSGAYTMGPGVDLIGSIFWVEYDDGTSSVANNNDGIGVVGGVRLTF